MHDSPLQWIVRKVASRLYKEVQGRCTLDLWISGMMANLKGGSSVSTSAQTQTDAVDFQLQENTLNNTE